VKPVKIPDEGTSSSNSESCGSNQSATSKRVDERRLDAGGDWPQGGGLTSTSQRLPRRYGARSTRVRVNNDQEAGLQAIIGNDDEDGMAMGGDSDRWRVVTACYWLEGGEEGHGGDLDVGGGIWKTWMINCSI